MDPVDAAPPSALGIELASGLIGASVSVDLDALLGDPSMQGDLRTALAEHLVLVLRGLDPSPAQHVALARILGDLQPTETYNVAHPDFDEITVFDSAGGYKADHWHADATWRDIVPSAAVLCMRQCPSAGGDTVFANCVRAHDDLSDGMKQLLHGRRARHDIGPDDHHDHPVVIRHPITGKSVLFVNRIFTRAITNLPPEESEAILPFLFRHVTRPELTYRHRWRTGDMLIWDNWAVQHYALADFRERRVVHRVAIAGQRLQAAD